MTFEKEMFKHGRSLGYSKEYRNLVIQLGTE